MQRTATTPHAAESEIDPLSGPVARSEPTRSRSSRTGNPYTVDSPPPYDPPPGVTEVTGWQLAAAQWREHLPDELMRVECTTCSGPWPCDAWEIANDLITACCDTAADLDVA